MRKKNVKWGIFLLLIAGGMLLYGKNSQKKDNQKMLDFSIIIKGSILQTKKLEENLSPYIEEAESKKTESQEEVVERTNSASEDIRNFEKAELVEMISNPQLLKWTRLEDFIPFISFAEAMNLEEQTYEYAPRADLEDLEEIKAWGEEILYDLVLYPERVEEYGAVLTLTSVEAWESFQWIYANPEDYYCSVYTDGWKGDNGEYVNLITRVGIPADFFLGDLHRLNALDRTYAEGVSQELFDFIEGSRDIGIRISWTYGQESGLIQIKGIDYQKLGGG